MPLDLTHNTIILDASCLISLYASGQLEGILRAVPGEIAIAAYVANREALWIRSEDVEQNKRTRELINLQPFVDAGLLTLVTLETEAEAETTTTLVAQRLGQGEAITGAIAIHRDWAIAIDDRRARRLIQEVASSPQLFYALDLVKHWTEINTISSVDITTTLQSIRRQAAYTPHAQDPLYNWWHLHEGG